MEVGATSSKLVIRSTSGVSMHSAATSHGVDGPGCARPWPSHVQRDTNVRRDARVWAQPKWNSIALVAQQEELPPCNRQVARSLWAAKPTRTLRSNGPKAERSEQPSPRAPPDMSCSSRWPRTPDFGSAAASQNNPGTLGSLNAHSALDAPQARAEGRVRSASNPARDANQRSLRRAHASRAEIGRNDWAAPEPVTGWIPSGV